MKKYYLFLRQQEELDEYKKEFMRVSEDIKNGVTPVYSELRSAEINLYESLPYNSLVCVFMILATYILTRFNINEIVAVGLSLVMNNVFGVIANWIFVSIKHKLRLKLCRRLDIEPTEHNIAVMESLEYQSV